ncbi:N-terminal nucleophile aminohydrolase [Aspergillus campestris IBT 28561]|uniref:N-terminal nucleophile aminohydrolase n=1 Tax=Aspergillus campestris (strain IBT 28561) TaxID=1392248 RepID=A0A2I1D018_ASPC2|nr:N-terminal nucleophile aminohydrolase [Aspergillus campestris IBT 28561]PKY03220.1 N-terminal nucleophile aminohydrolase [Aspergillus campestris IBT 28561]
MFQPTLIIHGGAGAIQRSTLPPDLYSRYHASLLSYLRSTKDLLDKGTPALDAAVHAVSLMEDDELFNCGRGSVFTKAGTIEMEASVMVSSVLENEGGGGAFKRAAGVMGLKNVRHPIRLARESLLRTGHDANGKPTSDGGSMHSQLAAPYVEELAREWGLEFKPDEWFFTQRRWDEHRRGLEGKEEPVSMSQGTVGCVCLDRWGGLAVATSTGGMTNKLPGRIGDTPTLGAGFWAESWDGEVGGDGQDLGGMKEMVYRAPSSPAQRDCADLTTTYSLRSIWDDIFGNRTSPPSRETVPHVPSPPSFMCSTNICTITCSSTDIPEEQHALIDRAPRVSSTRKRAMALSGTGNGDSFLRVAAARTACAITRFSPHEMSAAAAVTAIAGPGGELQRSAGPRWRKTGEGEGGIIGIEARVEDSAEDGQTLRGTVVFDFNCGGMWRAWIETGDDGYEVERVMVFREEYR